MLSPYIRPLLRPSAPRIERCILCQSRGSLRQRHVIFKANFFTGRAFYQCDKCGFAYDVLAGPTPDSFYQQNYASGRFDRSGIDFRYRTTEAVDLSMCLNNSGITPKRVLEIGPGPGWFMESFLACNPETAYDVIELTDFGAESCRTLGASEVHAINFETQAAIGALEGRYDVVVSIHCIEHLFNPLAAMANMLRCLKPDGVLYVHTPNYNNATNDDWHHYKAPDHICFFSTDSFSYLGKILGYDMPVAVIAYDCNDVIALLRPKTGRLWRVRRSLLARLHRRPIFDEATAP